MSQNITISANAKNIVDNFINENRYCNNRQSCPISKTDVMKHVIVTLYSQMPNAKSELIEPFKDCIFDLHDYFTQDEIDVILAEAKAVIMYCHKFADVMGHIDFHEDSILTEEIVDKDAPYSIYKTPESVIELCMRLSGKSGKNDKVIISYGEVADYALYNPNAEYQIECDGSLEDDHILKNDGTNDYYELLLDSQGISYEVTYDDGNENKSPNYLPDYVFAFNPTLSQTRKYDDALSYCDGMWQHAQKVSTFDLMKKICTCCVSLKPGKYLDFILPSEYLKDKYFFDYFYILTQEKKYNTTIISLPEMHWGDTYVDTFLLHIEKVQNNGEMIRLIDTTASEFYQKRDITEEGRKALYKKMISDDIKSGLWTNEEIRESWKEKLSNDYNGPQFSVTNPKHYQMEGLNVDRIMEIVNSEKCNAKYEERMSYKQFFGINEHVKCQHLIDKTLPKLQDGENYIALKELVDIVSSNRIEKGKLPLLVTSLLSDKYTDCEIDAKNIDTKDIEKEPKFWSDSPSYFTMENYCLVAGIDGVCLKVGKLMDINQPIAYKEGITSFHVKKGLITEDYLLRELTKEYCTTQALMLCEHYDSGIDKENFLDPEYFLDIKIAVPSLEEQERRCKDDIRKSLEESRKNLTKADRQLLKSAEEFKRDVHMKKHAIGQTLFNLSNWWDLLQRARKDGNGIVDDTKEVGKIHKVLITDIFSNIQMSMKKLQMQIDSFWRADGLQTEDMSLSAFINAYTKEHQSPLFTYKYVANIINNKLPKVTFSKQALTMVFDNIINNACCHGFENEASSNNIVKIDLQMDKGLPCIIISNNGKPIHEKISIEDVFTYGRSSKSGQKHYGIGGYEVRNLMREFHGEAEFISTPQNEFPVSYKLTFKNTNNNVER